MTRICIAGVTGWVGSAIVKALPGIDDLTLVSAMARRAAGQTVGAALGIEGPSITIVNSVPEALAAEPDVFVDYTSAAVVRDHVLEAVRGGVHVVIGTSGLSDDDYSEIDREAVAHNVGVLAAGNFAISAVLLQHFAQIAARHMPSWEIIDYASAGKRDAPSGTARELASRLAHVGPATLSVPIAATLGEPGARGATLNGMQVHSVRLPGIVIGVDVHFGLPSERLTLQYMGGSGPEPYVAGTLLAVRRVREHVGVRRGLDQLLGLGIPN